LWIQRHSSHWSQRDYITYLVGRERERKRAMTGNKDEGPADAVASGGAKFVLEPKEVVSTVKIA
jgi:hypothetical protein